jgi:lipoate-protein ligase A
MDLYNLGKVPWQESQLIYHALAQMEREALCLVSPVSPYVCIGFHQDVEQEVDLAFCHKNRIPVFRREVGGGAVFLDGNQLFFQLILSRDNPIVPKRIDRFYQKFLQPIIAVHHRIGIAAAYKPVNDLVIESRKISGTGVGEIGNCIAFVGNLILDFDYATMAKVLKIPDEKFRDKVKKTIEENLSTICRELGLDKASQWTEDRLNNMLAEEFTKLVGSLTSQDKDPALIEMMTQLQGTMMLDDWLFRKGKREEGKKVKVRAGLELLQRVHKAAGGLIRSEFTIADGRYRDVSISGDFFCFPRDTVDRLAGALEGKKVKDINQILGDFYAKTGFELPGIQIDDWIQVFKAR